MENYRVLVVDNEKRLLDCLEMMLSIEGHTVMTAENGKAACDLLQKMYAGGSAVDLLITDIWMPQMSGLDLIDKLNRSNIKPAIIGISGYVDNDTVADLAAKGCVNLITKPFAPEVLLKKISDVMK
jgi:CheY-like chemotaxis protein